MMALWCRVNVSTVGDSKFENRGWWRWCKKSWPRKLQIPSPNRCGQFLLVWMFFDLSSIYMVELMMNWWWIDDELMMNWWWIDESWDAADPIVLKWSSLIIAAVWLWHPALWLRPDVCLPRGERVRSVAPKRNGSETGRKHWVIGVFPTSNGYFIGGILGIPHITMENQWKSPFFMGKSHDIFREIRRYCTLSEMAKAYEVLTRLTCLLDRSSVISNGWVSITHDGSMVLVD